MCRFLIILRFLKIILQTNHLQQILQQINLHQETHLKFKITQAMIPIILEIKEIAQPIKLITLAIKVIA